MARKIWPAIALTGGGVGALDGIDGALLTNGDGAITIMSTGLYHHTLTTNASTEDSPLVIVPNANPGTFCWELL